MEQHEIDFIAATRKASVVKLHGVFSTSTKPDDVADLLWRELGWNIPASCISISPNHTNPYVTVVLTRESCADFLQRAFEQAGQRAVRVIASNFGLKSQKQMERYAGHRQ